MDNKPLWQFNSAAQNDLLAQELIASDQHVLMESLLKSGFPLTAFILCEMHYHSWAKSKIKTAFRLATIINDDAKKWLPLYFEVEDIHDLFFAKPELATDEFPSDSDCIKFKLWDILCNREQWLVVANFAPEILEQKNCVESSRALLESDFEKYAPLVFERHHHSVFLNFEEGWKYLIDHGSNNWISKIKDCGHFLPSKDIIAYCIEKGLIDEVYKAHYYDELLEYQQFDVFVKNHSFCSDFLEKYPDKVDWEDLWQHASDKSTKSYLKEIAFRNQNIQKCNDFLWKHCGIIGRFRLLAGG